MSATSDLALPRTAESARWTRTLPLAVVLAASAAHADMSLTPAIPALAIGAGIGLAAVQGRVGYLGFVLGVAAVLALRAPTPPIVLYALQLLVVPLLLVRFAPWRGEHLSRATELGVFMALLAALGLILAFALRVMLWGGPLPFDEPSIIAGHAAWLFTGAAVCSALVANASHYGAANWREHALVSLAAVALSALVGPLWLGALSLWSGTAVAAPLTWLLVTAVAAALIGLGHPRTGLVAMLLAYAATFASAPFAALVAAGGAAVVLVVLERVLSAHVSAVALARSEAVANAILDNAVDAIITIGSDGVMQGFNRAAQRTFGYAPDEVLGRNVSMLMPEPHRSAHDGYLRRYLETGERKIIGIGRELEALRKDGSVFPIYLAVSEVSAGGERAFTGIIRDIGGQKAAEEEIRRQNEQLGVTLHNAPLGTATFRLDGPVVTSNRAFEAITGYSSDELRSRTFEEIVEAEHRTILARLMAKIRTGELQAFDHRLRLMRRDGKPVETRCHFSATHDQEGHPDLLIVQVEDLTQHLAAEEAAREHQDKLAHVMRLSTLGEMAAGIAHEINQPLTAIAMYAQASMRMLDAGLPDQRRLRDALEKLGTQSLRAGAVIDRMQRLVQHREGEREPVQLNQTIEDILRLAESDARVNDVRIEIDAAPHVPPVMADPIQIQQVLLNLIRNAIDAMRAIDCRNGNVVKISTRVLDGFVEAAVADSGTGVSEEFASQLFTPFVTTKETGTGMGLAICRSIIEIHGGRLAFRNNEKHGATFYFRLPMETRDAA